MKSGRVLTVVLILALMGSILSGCLSVEATSGTGVTPVPVTPSTWIPASQIWSEINARVSNAGIVIAMEQNGYNSVSVNRIRNALSELVLDCHWGALTRAEALVITVRRADPQAAVGLALLGPPNDARYWVIAADVIQGQLIIRLVDPLTGRIQCWDNCIPAGFVVM